MLNYDNSFPEKIHILDDVRIEGSVLNFIEDLAQKVWYALNVTMEEKNMRDDWDIFEVFGRINNETKEHMKRVWSLNFFLLNLLKQNKVLGIDSIKEDEEYEFGFATVFHDIGKIGIPIEILEKDGKLTKDERETIKTHTEFGALIIQSISKHIGESSILKKAVDIALYHHEKYNGNGYPYQISGEEIPIEARIVAVVDVFDALTSVRSYKQAFNKSKVIEIMKNFIEEGHFDPHIGSVFLKNIDGAFRLKEQLETKSKRE